MDRRSAKLTGGGVTRTETDRLAKVRLIRVGENAIFGDIKNSLSRRVCVEVGESEAVLKS